MISDAVLSEEVRRYLARWATWWSNIVEQLTLSALLERLLAVALHLSPRGLATSLCAQLCVRAETGIPLGR